MKIAILGGGFTGLTAAYFLSKKGHKVTVFEKEKILGGMASGFKARGWQWYLERTYHHLFANDDDILDFAKEIGFNQIFFREPETASLYQASCHPEFISGSNFNKIPKWFDFAHHPEPVEGQVRNDIFFIYPLDTPLDFLRFPLLSLPEKLRAGAVLALLKLSPFLSFYEKWTAKEFFRKTIGKKVWNILWRPLFREKFGKYAENILASFIWARIKKRTKKLGYIEGGFQILIDYLVNRLKGLRVNVLTGYGIKEIKKRGDKFIINNTLYDVVVSTLPTQVLTKVSQTILPKSYLNQLSKIEYLHSLTLILETDKPILDKTYWLNISAPNIPIMGIVQHTNFMDKKNYGNKHIAYLGWYLKLEDRRWKMEDRELLNYVKPYLNKIFNFQFSIFNSYVFRSPFAQPIFDKEFLKNKPDFTTPLKNFFIANLDMTYPYDRGTNFAVKLGKEISRLI